MSITFTPTKATYLERVADGLSDLPAEDREEVLQDLEAHLAELDDAEIQRTLGDPETFVSEFRASAGLDVSAASQTWEVVRALVRQYDEFGARLSSLTRWPILRPTWVLIRGWLIVVTWSFLYNGQLFSRFLIPSVGSSSLSGLFFVILATAASVWLDRGRGGVFRFASAALSFLAFWWLVASLLNTPEEPFEEAAFYPEQLVGPEGNVITNIYAYGLDGEPVEVLLFDQDGRPLLTFPPYVYDEAELGGTEISYWGGGSVSFTRDQFGRVIANLYPLTLEVYDDYGGLAPMPPPSLGFPSVDEGEPGSAVTTTMPGDSSAQ